MKYANDSDPPNSQLGLFVVFFHDSNVHIKMLRSRSSDEGITPSAPPCQLIAGHAVTKTTAQRCPAHSGSHSTISLPLSACLHSHALKQSCRPTLCTLSALGPEINRGLAHGLFLEP